MIYLSPGQVLFIHARVVSVTGGSHGVRDLGLLESAVARPHAAFEGKEFYPEEFSKAAALMESLLKDHPFADGNKRTAFASAGVFLRLNGWRLTASAGDVVAQTMRVAINEISLDDVAVWLRSNSVRLK